MKKLILDTATDILYVALMDGTKVLYEKRLLGRKKHSEYLIKIIKEALSQNRLEVKDLAGVIVGVGPGSYTGSRVSLVIAKMFAFTHNVPLFVLSSLDMAASAYLEKDGEYAVMIRAKKDYVYSNILKVKNGVVSKIKEDSFVLKEEFLSEIENKNIFIIDDENIDFNASVISEKLISNQVENIHTLEPNYLRKSIWNIKLEKWELKISRQ